MKMKKLITLLLALAMVLSVAACGSNGGTNTGDNQGSDTNTAPTLSSAASVRWLRASSSARWK